MGCEAGRCNKSSTPQGISIVIPSLEGWPTKAKGAPSPHEVRLTLLGTKTVFQCLEDKNNSKDNSKKTPRQMSGGKDGQTLFHRILPTTIGCQ